MLKLKEQVGEFFKGKIVRFKCDCIMKLDFTGTVQGYILEKNDHLILLVSYKGKIIRIDENHPNLYIELL